MRRAKSDYSIQTVTNALSLLETFDDAESLGVSEISRRLGLHKNNVFRLLATLEERGYIEQEAGGDRYRLGVRCLDLGQTFLRSRSLMREAQPLLDALSAAVGENPNHAQPGRGFEVVHAAAAQPERLLIAGIRTGRRLPAYCTALGRALLAFSDDAVREAFDRRLAVDPPRARSAATVTDRIKLVEQLRNTASAGFAIDLGECEDGLSCAAAPVIDGLGRLVGALSITGPSSRLGEDRLLGSIAPVVVDHANTLASRLGRARPAGSFGNG